MNCSENRECVCYNGIDYIGFAMMRLAGWGTRWSCMLYFCFVFVLVYFSSVKYVMHWIYLDRSTTWKKDVRLAMFDSSTSTLFRHFLFAKNKMIEKCNFVLSRLQYLYTCIHKYKNREPMHYSCFWLVSCFFRTRTFKETK